MSFSNLLVFFNGAVRTTIDTVCHAIDCKQGSKMVRHCALCFRCQWGFRLAAILIKVGLVNQNMVFRFSKTAVLALTVPAVKFLALLAINYGLGIVPFVQTRCTQKVVIINRVISAHFKHFHKLSAKNESRPYKSFLSYINVCQRNSNMKSITLYFWQIYFTSLWIDENMRYG